MTDDQQRQVASEIERSRRLWLVMWGCYTRLFWAFPLFEVPRGTIVSAPDRERLLTAMQTVEVEQNVSSWVPSYASSTPVPLLPRRGSRWQMPPGELAGAPTPAEAPRPEGWSAPAPAPRPRGPGSSVPAARPGMRWTPQTEPRPASREYDPYVPDPHDSDPYDADP
jgi:hypothetical protein